MLEIPVKPKHSLAFKFFRAIGVCGDHIPDSNNCVYDIYLNPYHPITYLLLLFLVPFSLLYYGINSSRCIYRELTQTLSNYHPKK